MHTCKAAFLFLQKIFFRTGVLKTLVACRRGVLFTRKVPKLPGGWPLPRPHASSLSGSLSAPLSARRYLMRAFSAPFIVGMRAVLHASKLVAMRHHSGDLLPHRRSAAEPHRVPGARCLLCGIKQEASLFAITLFRREPGSFRSAEETL